MATRVTFKKKKRSYGGKRYKPKLNPVQKDEVKQLINNSQETKKYEISGNTTFNSSATVAARFAIVQGSQEDERIGTDLGESHMEIKYRVYCDSLLGTPDAYNNVRVIYFQWRENNALGTPTAAAILTLGSANDYVNALYNYENRMSYKILHDRVHNVSYQNGVCANVHRKFVKIPHKIRFNDVNGTQAFNQIYILVVSDSTTVPHPNVMNTTRLYFKDA